MPGAGQCEGKGQDGDMAVGRPEGREYSFGGLADFARDIVRRRGRSQRGDRTWIRWRWWIQLRGQRALLPSPGKGAVLHEPSCRGLLRECSHSGLKRSHNVSMGTAGVANIQPDPCISIPRLDCGPALPGDFEQKQPAVFTPQTAFLRAQYRGRGAALVVTALYGQLPG